MFADLPYSRVFEADENRKRVLTELAHSIGPEHAAWECEWLDAGRVLFAFASGDDLVYFDALIALSDRARP